MSSQQNLLNGAARPRGETHTLISFLVQSSVSWDHWGGGAFSLCTSERSYSGAVVRGVGAVGGVTGLRGVGGVILVSLPLKVDV